MIQNTTSFPQNMSYSQTLNGAGNWTAPGGFDSTTPINNSQWNPNWMTDQQFPTGGMMAQGLMSGPLIQDPWMQGPCMKAGQTGFGINPSTNNWFSAPLTSNSFASQYPMFSFSGQQTENPFTYKGFGSPSMNPLGTANVRFIDNDTETIIEIHALGLNMENSEVSTIANEIRVRFFGGSTRQTSEMSSMLVLPMPTFGDNQQVQAAATNDFLRIVVATRKEIANTIKKIKPTKLK
ncbi:MAG: hypothetical protein ABFQ95_06150 [Pseudomonadota bacterium]